MNIIETHEEAIAFIYQSYNRAKRNVNGRYPIQKQQSFARELLDAIGKPDYGKQIILVTGSKGKGSTATFISSLLSILGWKTGLFTSPHLLTFNERIQIGGKMISDHDFIRLANQIQPYVYDVEQYLETNEYLGPIAINLAIAMLYFQENHVDYIILEIGKGGLFDDTNVVNNRWAVITPVIEEHLHELGPTISEVVTHKLGIIKEDTEFAFIAKQQPHTETIIHQQLAGKSTHIFAYGRDFDVQCPAMTSNGTSFDLITASTVYKNLTCPLLGTFQCENIALAMQTCEIITKKKLSFQAVQKWLLTLANPGKCEVLSSRPLVIADAAIHRESAKYLQEMIQNHHFKKVVSIIGLSNDKDYKGVIDTLSSVSDHMIISRPQKSYKYFPEREITEYANSLIQASPIPSFTKAISLTILDSSIEVIFIVGNHSFIAEAKQWFTENSSMLEQQKTLKTTI